MTLTIGIVAILVPIAAALYLAHRQVTDEAAERGSAVARELLGRADTMGTQAITAYHLLVDAGFADPCSDKALTLMRDIALKFNYLEVVGAVRDGHLVCSSFGRYDKPLALGPVAYVSTLDAKVRPSVDLGISNGHRLLLFQKGPFAVAIQPDTMLDIFTGAGKMSIGIFGMSSGKLIGNRGAFDPGWPARLREKQKTSFFDGKHLVVMRRSKQFDLATYAAIPASELQSLLYGLAWVLVPLGLLLGLGLSLAVFFLARQQNSLSAILRSALKRGEFALHYQPVVDMDSGRLAGVEALLRWNRRGGGGLGPSVFIPVAEESGLIGRITEYVLERVAEDAPAFLARHPDCYISINLSSSDMHSQRIVASLRRLLAVPGIAPGNLMVEVTEYGLLDVALAGPVMKQIRALDIRVAIDDFGTGFSNLSHLATLEIDCVKIDKLFVETGGTQSATSHVALHLIDAARELGLGVIAEGVETEAQVRFLREHGVTHAQGWLYAKAMPMEALLRSWRWCPVEVEPV